MQTIRILHLEDSAEDADLIERELLKAGLKFTRLWVTNKDDFEAALQSFWPHVILSDHSLPTITSVEALNAVRETGINVPFILITGTVSEEFAVSMLKKGVADYLLKDRMERLPAAIIKALEKWRAENERQKFLEKIIKNENLLRETEKLAHIGSWKSNLRTGKLEWSDEAYAIYGYKPKEVVPSLDLILELIHPDDLDKAKTTLKDTFRESNASKFGFRIIDKSGTVKYLETQVVVDRNKEGQAEFLRGFYQDVTENKKAEQVITQNELKYRHLFHNNPMPMWVIEKASFKFLDVNNSAVKHYGYSRQEFLSFTALSIRPQEDIEEFMKLKRQDFSYPSSTGLWRHVIKNKSVIDVEINTVDIMYEGIPSRLVLVNDVTEKLKSEAKRKKAEEALIAVNESLEEKVTERTAELQNANHELESFSYTVSHDLQAPLRALSGFAEIMLESYGNKVDEEGKHILKVIDSSARRMSGLIHDLLAFSKLGKSALKKQEVDMNELVRVVIEEIKHETPAFKAKIKVQQLNALSCDASLMKQVWANLIRNAVKYSSKKEKPVIEIGMKEINKQIAYYIKDNGAGFNMKHADRMFGVFQRLHPANEFEGTGVGLATVHQIVTRHGGKVWAEGVEEEKAVFYFAIPAANIHRSGEFEQAA